MFQLLCILISLTNYYIHGVTGKCSYYQTGGVAVPTDRCINTTLLSDNTYVSNSYTCHFGIFVTKMYVNSFNTANCQGVAAHTSSYPCNSPTCTCSESNSASQCNTNTFSYDTIACPRQPFKQRNLTVITSECINSVRLSEYNNTLYYLKYDDTDTNCQDSPQIAKTCYTLDTNTNSNGYDYYDYPIDPYDPYNQPTTTTNNSNVLLFEGYKQIFIIGVIVIIFFGTFCTICCMIKKYKKRKQINQIADAHKKNLIENNEFHEEGVENYNNIGEQIDIENINIIPGQNEMIPIDENIVNKIVNEYINDSDIDENDSDIDENDNENNIPAPAFSDNNGNDNDDNEDENELDYSISEGDEGIVNEESVSTDNENELDYSISEGDEGIVNEESVSTDNEKD